MRSYKIMQTFKKLQKLSVNFKHVGGYYKMKELKIGHHSGYVIFEDIKDSDKTVYITAMDKTREDVAYKLCNDVLGKLFWTSRVDLARVNSDNSKFL